MDLKNLFNQFEKQYLYVNDTKRYKGADKEISKAEVMTFFSVYVNYHSDKCIHIIKDTQLTTYLWRDLKKRYDLTKLFINEEMIYNLI